MLPLDFGPIAAAQPRRTLRRDRKKSIQRLGNRALWAFLAVQAAYWLGQFLYLAPAFFFAFLGALAATFAAGAAILFILVRAASMTADRRSHEKW